LIFIFLNIFKRFFVVLVLHQQKKKDFIFEIFLFLKILEICTNNIVGGIEACQRYYELGWVGAVVVLPKKSMARFVRPF